MNPADVGPVHIHLGQNTQASSFLSCGFFFWCSSEPPGLADRLAWRLSYQGIIYDIYYMPYTLPSGEMLKVVGKGGVEEEDADQREDLKFENQLTKK